MTSFGQFESYYLDNQLADFPKQTVSWIGSLQIFFTFVGSLPAGRYFDAHGARHLMIVGTSLSIISLICLACRSPQESASLTRSLQRVLPVSPRTRTFWYLRSRAVLSCDGCRWTLVHEAPFDCCRDHRLWFRIGWRHLSNCAWSDVCSAQ